MALISPGAQSTMKAAGFHSGSISTIFAFKAAIQGVKSASAHLEVRMNATGIPLCHSSKTIRVYNGNCVHKIHTN